MSEQCESVFHQDIRKSLASLGLRNLEADYVRCHAALGGVMQLTWKPEACGDEPARMWFCGSTSAQVLCHRRFAV